MKIVLVLVVLIGAVVAYALFAFVVLKTQIVLYKNFWQKQSTGSGEIIYVAMGDSTAQGIGASRPQTSYVWRYAKNLEAQTGKKVKIVNISRSGAKTKEVLEVQLPQLARVKPDYVTLGIGSNDITAKTKYEDLESDFKAIFALLPKGTVVGEVPFFNDPADNALVERVNTLINQQAAEYGLKVALIYDAYKTKLHQKKYHSLDFFHPNDWAYREWYLAFKNAR